MILMNSRHDKQLEAVINGHRCVFHGEFWSASDPQLEVRLNRALAEIPLPRLGLFEVADEVIHRLGESAVSRIQRNQMGANSPRPCLEASDTCIQLPRFPAINPHPVRHEVR